MQVDLAGVFVGDDGLIDDERAHRADLRALGTQVVECDGVGGDECRNQARTASDTEFVIRFFAAAARRAGFAI